MKITVIPAGELTEEEFSLWSRLQRSDPALASCFLRPEFTRAVAQVRDDVEVALFEEDAEIVGFFPFQRGHWNCGHEVGGRLSNCQGVIAAKGVTWDAEKLIQACRLSTWKFGNLITSQEPFRRCHKSTAGCRYMDLSNGYDAFINERRRSGSRRLRENLRRQRKLKRDCPSLRIVEHTTDRLILRRMIAWKSRRFRTTNHFDVFSQAWACELLDWLLDNPSEGLSPVQSVLYLDEEPAAIFYGLRSHENFDGWFMTYSERFSKHSPGIVLLLELSRLLSQSGVQRYYLGAGSDVYKRPLTSACVPVSSGFVSSPRIAGRIWNGLDKVRSAIKRSPLETPTKVLARKTRPLRYWFAYRWD